MRQVSDGGSSDGNRSAPSTRIVGEPGKRSATACSSLDDLAHRHRNALAERRPQVRERRRVRRAALPEEQLYFHLIEQPTGFVCGLATGRWARTSSSASRSQAAFRDGSP